MKTPNHTLNILDKERLAEFVVFGQMDELYKGISYDLMDHVWRNCRTHMFILVGPFHLDNINYKVSLTKFHGIAKY